MFGSVPKAMHESSSSYEREEYFKNEVKKLRMKLDLLRKPFTDYRNAGRLYIHKKETACHRDIIVTHGNTYYINANNHSEELYNGANYPIKIVFLKPTFEYGVGSRKKYVYFETNLKHFSTKIRYTYTNFDSFRKFYSRLNNIILVSFERNPMLLEFSKETSIFHINPYSFEEEYHLLSDELAEYMSPVPHYRLNLEDMNF